MKKDKYLLAILLMTAVVVGIYLSVTRDHLKNEVKNIRDELEELRLRHQNVLEVLTVDSLLLADQFDEAERRYRSMASDTTNSLNKILHRRLVIARTMRTNDRDRVIDTTSAYMRHGSVKDSLEKQIARRERTNDSLNFALQKASMQLRNMAQQLKTKSYGEYLIFNNARGHEVHYIGSVEDAKANGKGIAILSTGSRYQGEWKDNMKHGHGIFYWPDGEYYEGDYQNDKRSGQGTYYWPNGEKYVGGWKDGQRNGHGVFYDKDGKVVASGIWKDDELEKVE